MPTLSPEKQLAGFIDKFAPEVAALIRAARNKMRERLPAATELVYDNYNFFVIGYGPGDRPSEAIFSIAAHAKVPLPASGAHHLIIRSVSAKQRPRRPRTPLRTKARSVLDRGDP